MSSVKTAKSADDEILECLDLDRPVSFFLFAGAGSGKTRSLVTALKKFRDSNGERLRISGQKVAIITYTNAACDEIKRRLEFDASFSVSTIHSFAWELINAFTSDIKDFLRTSLVSDISDLIMQQEKAKSKTTKTYIDRTTKIESKRKRLNVLEQIRKFSYNPNGENTGKDSLNHSEVIELAAFFLQNKRLMQDILVRKFPILLIDESQDTKKNLVEAFFEVQKRHVDNFSLGMFGDTMQRIYLDGKENLGDNVPDTWAKPKKEENYRCPRRVVQLINRIRKDVDGKSQIPVKKMDGSVRLFIKAANQMVDRTAVESDVASRMCMITGDEKWAPQREDFKLLTLEHHMAAKRGGFSPFFDPLYKVEKLRTGLLDGSWSFVSLFASQILPLILAKRSNNDFLVARIARQYSPMLKRKNLKHLVNQEEEVKKVGRSVRELLDLWESNGDPRLSDVLKTVYSSGLFQIPEILVPIAERLNSNAPITGEEESDDDAITEAMETALNAPFSVFERYVSYISDVSRFGTHQGVKGLEFPRVMVVLDDEDARGFLFSYEKLFGAEEPSETDIKNKQEGKETSLERTRRLFYVTCSRAEESLAIVVFSNYPEKVKSFALKQEWFVENEIIMLS